MNEESDNLGKREFGKVYNRFFSFFYQIAFHFLREEEDAKEVVQEAFIKLWEKQIYVKPESEIKNYLFILVRNQCLNLLREKRKNAEKLTSQEYFAVNISYKLLNATGEDILLSAELSEKIRIAISRLTPQCMTVFTLSRFEDMSNSEIAAKLNISVKAVEANMTRALKQLREELSSYLSENNERNASQTVRIFLLSFL
ncbi:MAG: RNA polymerase sigma-70 factor [Mangrovibacterium sp.]